MTILIMKRSGIVSIYPFLTRDFEFEPNIITYHESTLDGPGAQLNVDIMNVTWATISLCANR